MQRINQYKNSLKLVKIHFSIQKQLQYGEAIYVIGNIQILGNWNILDGLRLNWNQGHNWSGFIIVETHTQKQIQFQYTINKWDQPSQNTLQSNQAQIGRLILSIMEIQLSAVIVKQSRPQVGDVENKPISYGGIVCSTKFILCCWKYLVISWKNKKKLKPIQIKGSSSENLLKNSAIASCRSQTVYSLTFMVHRNRKNFRYYYIINDGEIKAQRHPGRFIHLNNFHFQRHPDNVDIIQKSSQTQIYETCKFNKVHFSMITDSIYLGAYLRTQQDFKQLQKHNITAVLSIQATQDYDSHALSAYYLKLLSEEQGIKHYSYSIKDMCKEDFIEKCLGAFLLLRRILTQQQHQKVYVHCSAGMYRSPQIIVLYLILVEGYLLDQAMNIVMEKHPFARPNYNLLTQALSSIQRKISKLTIKS